MTIHRPILTDAPLPQQEMGFAVVELVEGEIYTPPHGFSLHSVLCPLKGDLRLFTGDIGRPLPTGRMAILPMGRQFRVEAVGEVRLLVFRFIRVLPQAARPLPAPLGDASRIEPSGLLVPSPLLSTLISQLTHYVLLGIGSAELFEAKQLEFFLLLQSSLPANAYAGLLRQLSAHRHSFKSQVISLADRCDSVSQLASMMHVDRTHFFRLFKREFGESPSQWLLRRKVSRVRTYFYSHPDEPLKVAAEQLGFSSMTVLEDFCVQNLHQTASQLARHPEE